MRIICLIFGNHYPNSYIIVIFSFWYTTLYPATLDIYKPKLLIRITMICSVQI